MLCMGVMKITIIPLVKNPPGASALRVFASRLSLFVGGSIGLALIFGFVAGGLKADTAAMIPGVVAISVTLITCATYITLYSLSLPLIGLFLLLRGGFREAVVAARTSALRDLPPALETMLREESIAELLGGGPPDHKEWSLTLWEDRLLSVGTPLSILGIFVGCFGGPAYCGLVQDSAAHGGAVAAVGIAVGILGAFMTSARGCLGAGARRQLQERHRLRWTQIPPSSPHSTLSSFHVRLPSGADLLWQEKIDVVLALPLDALPFRLRPVERKTLGLEESDLDSGDANFDRATIIEPRALLRVRGYASDESLCLPWLSPELRAVFLALLQRHCVLDDGGKSKDFPGSANLRVTLDLRDHDSLQALDETLVLFNRLSELYSALSPLSMAERAHRTLLAADSESERSALLDEAKQHASLELTEAVERRWIGEGRGATRLALMKKRTDLHPDGVRAITDDLEEALTMRSAALSWWLSQPEEHGGERLQRAVVTGEASLLYSLISAAQEPPSPAALSMISPALLSTSFAPDAGPPLLGLMLSWGLHMDQDQLRRLLPVPLLDPSRELVDLVNGLGRDRRLSEELRAECAAAAASLSERLEQKTREDRGGLSLEEQHGGGELSLGRSGGELEFSKPPDGDEP